MSGLLDHLPLWAMFGATVVLVLLSIEAGYWLGRYRRRRSEEEKEAPVGAIVAATLGLLGFMLAFTFSLAASRFDNRRTIVVEEANAIGTTYLRAGLLPDDRVAKIRQLLTAYVDARLEVVQTGDIDQLMRRSDALHRELWAEAEACGQKQPESIMVGLFIQTLNDMIDLHSKRVFVALRNRIPGILWATLYLLTMLNMAGVGYHEGLSKSRRTLAILALVLTFAAIITLVADLDRPWEGFLKVSQQALIDLRSSMNDTH